MRVLPPDCARNTLCRPVRRSPAEAGRVISFQLWDWHTDGEHYDLEHIQLLPAADTGERQVRTRRTTSWAITAAQLTALVATDGFTQISWHAPGGKPSEWVLGMPVAPLTRGRGGYG